MIGGREKDRSTVGINNSEDGLMARATDLSLLHLNQESSDEAPHQRILQRTLHLPLVYP